MPRSPSSTFSPNISLAILITELRVTPGRIDPPNFGVFNVFPDKANKFAEPISSTRVSLAARRYITSL